MHAPVEQAEQVSARNGDGSILADGPEVVNPMGVKGKCHAPDKVTCPAHGTESSGNCELPYGFFSSITRVSMMSSTLKSLKFCRPIPHS